MNKNVVDNNHYSADTDSSADLVGNLRKEVRLDDLDHDNYQYAEKSFENLKGGIAMLKKYNPAPLDVSEVMLPASLASLVDKLAENAHEIWAAERIREGWSYGSVRDDEKKETPCLVEYAALPEEEKNYDRKMVIGTLKAILKLGYTISPKNFVDSS